MCFLGIRNLIDLSLNNMDRLETILPNTFTPLNVLRKLELSSNPLLKIVDKETFSEHTDLVEVYMNNNSLINIDRHLLNWTQLKIFEFKDNPLTCSCDLLDITENLNSRITRNLDGPTCFDENFAKSRQVFELSSEICNSKPVSTVS